MAGVQHLLILLGFVFAQPASQAAAAGANPATVTAPPSFKFANSSVSVSSSNPWPVFSTPLGFNGSVPANGTGPQYASSCAAALASWSASLYEHEPPAIISVVPATYVETITTSAIVTGNYSILCDGLTRFDNLDTPVSTVVTLATPIYSTEIWNSTQYIFPSFTPGPSPSCSIHPDDCDHLSTAWFSSLELKRLSFYSENVLTISLASPPVSIVVNDQTTLFPSPLVTPPVLTLHGQTYPPLPGPEVAYIISNATDFQAQMTLTPGGYMTPTWDVDALYTFNPGDYLPCNADAETISTPTDTAACAVTAECTIYANEAQVMYFAPPSTSRDLCADSSPGYNRDSVSIYSQPHSSTIINGSTYWSDSVYLRFSAVAASMDCSSVEVPVGQYHTDVSLALPSSALSSLCSFQYTSIMAHLITLGATPYPFNYNDLVGPVPNSAFQCGLTCQGFCSTIVQNEYNPVLAVPSALRAIDPEWADCGFFLGGTYDPPTALASAVIVADPTPTGPSSGPTPDPVMTPPPVAPSTRAPAHTPQIPSSSIDAVDPAATQPPRSTQQRPPDHSTQRAPGESVQSADPQGQNGDPASGDPLAGSSRAGPSPSAIVVVEPGSSTPQTLHPGDPFGPSAMVVSVDPTKGIVVVSGSSGKSTIVIPSVIAASDSTRVAIATMGSHTVFANQASPSIVTIGDTKLTLSPGLDTVINGVSVTEGPSGLTMEDGQTTMVVPLAQLTTGTAGQYIVSGLEGSQSPESSGGLEATQTGEISGGAFLTSAASSQAGTGRTGGNSPLQTTSTRSNAASNRGRRFWSKALCMCSIWGLLLW